VSAALLFDGIARIARHEAAARPVASAAVVTSIYASDGSSSPDHAVSVKLRESGLVLPRVPIAVGAFGLAAIPSVGELVLVTFLEGDYNAPVVIGRLYHPDQNPPKHDEQQIVLRLPSGSDDPDLNCEIDSDPVKVTLTLPGDVSLEIKEDTVTVAAGDIKLTLNASGGGSFSAEAASTSITLKKDGDVAISSQQGKITLDGTEIDIKATGKMKITGATVEIN
jgi:phage baseplate assembly protein gpV